MPPRRVGVSHFIRSTFQIRIGQLCGQDQVRIKIGPGVVRRVDPAAAIVSGTVGEEQGLRVGVCQPGAEHVVRGLNGALELLSVGPRASEGRLLCQAGHDEDEEHHGPGRADVDGKAHTATAR